jgi:hypothetical protein
VTGGQEPRGLYIAGVAGGVGTSTLARIIDARLNPPAQAVRKVTDLGVFRPQVIPPGRQFPFPIHVLVSSNTGASAEVLADVVRGYAGVFGRPPVLAVMHTASGTVPIWDRKILVTEPFLAECVDFAHTRRWVELGIAPGRAVDKRVFERLDKLFQAVVEQWGTAPLGVADRLAPQQNIARPSPAPNVPATTMASPLTPRAGPPPPGWPPNGLSSHIAQRGGRGS